MQPAPAKVKLPELRYPADVTARMKATGVDPLSAEQRLSALPRDQAETTWGNVIDYYRRSTDASSKVNAYQGADKNYQTARAQQPINPAWTGWDDLGSQFKNSFVDLAQGVSDLIPSTVDLGMSVLSNPSDDSWYRKWDKATDDYFSKAKYYVSPEAQAAVWDDKNGLNWKAVAGMTGSTLGFLTTTMLPIIGQAGRVGQGATLASRILTDPRLQAGAIGYLQSLPGYKESALQAGYTRNQAAIIAPILSTAQSVLEFAGADALIKAARISPAEAIKVVRALGKESAADGFKALAGKALTEESFKDVINVTGKSFFDKLKTPEIRQAIFQNIKAGAASEGLEELTQQAAESAIQKMADIYYGYGEQGGKGFDPTVKQTLINSATGVLMGGIVGGSMGGMLGRTPTYVGQQTVWGKLDSDVRNLINQNPDLSIENNKEGLGIYRLTDKLFDEGKLTEQEYNQAKAGLDDMVRVSTRLANTDSDAQTRFALYNLDSQQRGWQNRIDSELTGPMQRLQELADERAPGQWFPKPGLNALDLAEASGLIAKNLPAKQNLAGVIQQTIDQSVSGLMNPSTKEQVLRSYQGSLDALADQWENGSSQQPDAPTKPDQYQEQDLPGLTRTMDTPDGRFALADTPDGREVFRVETTTEGQSPDVSEDTDPTIGRFRGYKLPSKGRPVVRLRTLADQTRHDELLDAFDQNPDVTESYGDWRSRLSTGYEDNQLDGLRQAEATYQQEANSLPADAPDWQKQDLARKYNWLKSAMASRAADSTESRYSQADWITNYLGNQLSQAGIDPSQVSLLSPDSQSALADALQSGDYTAAKQLINNGTLPTTPRPDELSSGLAAATERAGLLKAWAAVTKRVSEQSAVIDEIERLAVAGELTPDTEQRLMGAISELERALDEESAILAALNPEQSSLGGSPETGTSEPQDAGSSTPDESPASQQPDQSGSDQAGKGSDALVPQKRTGSSKPKVIDRRPQDLREAILQFFVQGGKLRRSDFARYGDPNYMRGAKGGNPYLNYVVANENAEPLDTLARQIVEEGLLRPVDSMDEQQVMQEIIDTVRSFASHGTPTQQLIDHQQSAIEQQNQLADQQVSEATSGTSVQALVPLMEGMDRAGIPAPLQEVITNALLDQYVDGGKLDWPGVVDLLRHNDLFAKFPALRQAVLPYIDTVTDSIPVSDTEIESEIASPSDLMSADWWSQMADEYHLSNEQYNSLVNDFYGEPASSVPESAAGSTEGNQVSADEEGSGVSGQGTLAPGEVGSSTAEDRRGQIPLDANQQAAQLESSRLFDLDISAIESENERLQSQVNKLRSDLLSRAKTDDVFTQKPEPFNSENKPAYFARSVDVPNGFSEQSVQQNPSRASVYEIVPVNNTEAIYRVSTNPNGQSLALSDTYTYLDEGTTYSNPPQPNADIVTIKPGRLIKNGGQWQIAQKAVVRFDTQTGQSQIGFDAPTGIEAQDNAGSKIRELQNRIAANQERIKNLQAVKEKLSQIPVLARQQTLFDQSDRDRVPVSPDLYAGIVSRLRETFSGIADDVRIVDSEAISRQAEIETGQQLRSASGTIYGFVAGDTVYLNGDQLNANTPIHEFAHIWNRWAKTNQPALYKEGIKKARANKAYYDAVASDPFYKQQADAQKLTGKAREEYFGEEALATAIGDQGERFVQAAARKGFLGWLDRLWSAIKDKLGIENKSAQEIADMSLEEFAGGVAARLLQGEQLASDLRSEDSSVRFAYGPAPSPTDQPARPIASQGASALSQLSDSFKKNSADRQAILQQSPQQIAAYLKSVFEPMAQAIVEYDAGSKVANALTRIRENNQPYFDAQTGEINPQVLASLAFELKANQYKTTALTGRLRDLLWEGSDSSEPDVLSAYKQTLQDKAIIDEDGNYEWPNATQENQDSLAAVDALSGGSNDPNAIKLLKGLLTSKWLGNVLDVETVGSLLSTSEASALVKITKTIRRSWTARAAEVRLRRNHLIGQLTNDLKGLSRFATVGGKVGDIGQVKTYQLPGWENGKAATLDLPVGNWLDLYFTIKTQLTTTGKDDPAKARSSALADVVNGKLVTTRTSVGDKNQIQKGEYGYQYTPAGEERPKTLLIDRNTYQQLEQLLLAEHPDIVQKVESLFADPVARSYVSGLYEIENGKPFQLEANYYPTQTWKSTAERDVVPSGTALLEESRILRERKSPPLKVVGMDALARISGYSTVEHRYIANSATRLNLTSWRKRNAQVLDIGPKWLTGYLQNLEQDLNDGGASRPSEDALEFEAGGIDLGLRAWMRRFSRSTFAFSLTTGPKQLLTHLNAYGLGIIETKYLQRSAGDMAKLAVDSYKLAKQSASKGIFGGELAETSYLEEMAKNPYMPTILDRVTGVDEAYLGRPGIDDIKAQPLNGSIALARKAAHEITDVGLRWVRASDRAVILSFWKGAQYQVEDKIANGQLRDESGNVVTDINSDAALREIARLTEEITYATNTMSGEGDSTPLQRSKGLAGAMLGLYSGQQQKLVNTCVRAINDYLKARAIGDIDQDKLRDRAIWTSTNLLLFNAIGVGMVNLLYKTLTGLVTGEEPQEDMLTALSWDVGRGLLGSVPSVPTEVILAASSCVDGPRWSDEVLSYAPSQSFQRVVEGMIAAKEYMTAEDAETATKRWNTLTYDLIDGGAHLAGIPVQVPKLLSRIAQDKPIKETDWSGQ